jgi:DNA helicase-2/ATP-dependent DNA helicase PcrA
MTRARDRLSALVGASSGRTYGRESMEGSRRSRFLDEVPAEPAGAMSAPTPSRPRTTWEDAVNSVAGAERFSPRPWNRTGGSGLRQVEELRGSPQRWKLGSKVRHAKYGVGTVLECEDNGEDSKLTISFPGYGRKKMVERFAGLERV